MKCRYIFIILSILALFSCKKAQLDLTYAAQEQKIDNYVKAQIEKDPSYTVSYYEGTTRLCTVAGEGEELKPGGTVSFFYSAYAFTGSTPSTTNLIATNDTLVAKQAGFILDEDQKKIITTDIPNKDFIKGLSSGLVGVQANGEYEIMFSGRLGYGNMKYGTVPVNSAMMYKVKIGGVSNK
ncbi:MAG: FKBP-type peptidyl-prolyl cis-trans isomerase [Bacteroidaceae bacterium]|nr:FKBP-type peptidyl-prolyl cis-trans isomerase [Bacteroidales bacterium]MCF0187856.1 FKBP-type peptidyl-prolyl cis-trans isomerase [Bacteroidaceae bacterium]